MTQTVLAIAKLLMQHAHSQPYRKNMSMYVNTFPINVQEQLNYIHIPITELIVPTVQVIFIFHTISSHQIIKLCAVTAGVSSH
jgi:hypothetical protein